MFWHLAHGLYICVAPRSGYRVYTIEQWYWALIRVTFLGKTGPCEHCWASVADADPTLSQHWFNVSCDTLTSSVLIRSQFEDFMLDCCFYLLDQSGLSWRMRGRPIDISRKISALVGIKLTHSQLKVACPSTIDKKKSKSRHTYNKFISVVGLKTGQSYNFLTITYKFSSNMCHIFGTLIK